MKYYIDTEFIERPCSIDLISVALVAEDGRELYIESDSFDEAKADDWVKENVIKHLWSRKPNKRDANAWSRDGGVGGLMPTYQIGAEVRKFIGDDKPEFWGYYCDYDWVVFCWLQGRMIDLPKGWPMYCRDLIQECDRLGVSPPNGPADEHNALADARWNMQLHQLLNATPCESSDKASTAQGMVEGGSE